MSLSRTWRTTSASLRISVSSGALSSRSAARMRAKPLVFGWQEEVVVSMGEQIQAEKNGAREAYQEVTPSGNCPPDDARPGWAINTVNLSITFISRNVQLVGRPAYALPPRMRKGARRRLRYGPRRGSRRVEPKTEGPPHFLLWLFTLALTLLEAQQTVCCRRPGHPRCETRRTHTTGTRNADPIRCVGRGDVRLIHILVHVVVLIRRRRRVGQDMVSAPHRTRNLHALLIRHYTPQRR